MSIFSTIFIFGPVIMGTCLVLTAVCDSISYIKKYEYDRIINGLGFATMGILLLHFF
jgi:hypothetical protein